MNRGVWIGGLFLSLCGWACQADAQEVVWRPANRPAELLPPVRLEVLPDASATLGRPVPLRPAARIDPGLATASYHPGAAPTPVPRDWPAGVDGPDAPVIAASENSLFAADRMVRPALFSGEPITVVPKPGAADAKTPSTLVAPPTGDACLSDEGLGLFPALGAWTPRFYARGEYLLWWFKKDQTPPLVTTSSPADNGFLTGATTRTLFGGPLDSGSHSGGRFTAGVWLDDCQTKTIEVSGFFLPGDDRRTDFNSAFFPVLARPFFSLNRGREFSELTASPGVSTGNVAVSNSSSLWGVEANLRCPLWCGCLESDECGSNCGCDPGWTYRVDGLVGFRYLNLREDLSIVENVMNLPTAPGGVANETAIVFDDFATRNQFYGAQVGLDAELNRGPWSLNVGGKLALGDTRQQIDIRGGQHVTFANGATRDFRGGLLALPSNIGSFHKDQFSIVPQVDLTLSYHLDEHWRVFGGYDFLYWTNVVRPGQQIDRVIDETQIPNFDPPGTIAPAGLNRPAVLFRQSDFWAQGIHLGLEYKY